jgi:hypothetical protein
MEDGGGRDGKSGSYVSKTGDVDVDGNWTSVRCGESTCPIGSCVELSGVYVSGLYTCRSVTTICW